MIIVYFFKVIIFEISNHVDRLGVVFNIRVTCNYLVFIIIRYLPKNSKSCHVEGAEVHLFFVYFVCTEHVKILHCIQNSDLWAFIPIH